MDLNHPAGGADAGPARPVELVAGDFLLTVNPVDGSEIESCPPGRRPIVPRRAAEAAEHAPPPAGPVLERDEERERLHRLLARGHSVRLVGPPGAGRTTLLTAVAHDSAGLAPDGVIRLTGYRRGVPDLLHELYAAVHHSPAHRPGSTELAAALREIGAVVVLDDVEFGDSALSELLDATPECAYLVATESGAPAQTPDPRLEELPLPGLSRTACLELLELALDRPLDEAETDWASDLWFETEGLPQRFVQAAAVLRHREAEAAVPLPNATALTATLARSLPEGAREVLRYAVALGGEVPDPARLPVLTGHPDAAADHRRLVAAGLLTAAGRRHRLAAGALPELLAAGYGEASADRTLTTAQHYAWWLTETPVSPARAAAEAEALLAAVRTAQRAGHPAAVATLARAAAPLLAAALHWGVWERLLRSGQETARAAGEVAQQAYFHHELGVLAIIEGQLDRARAELEASTALRGVLSDAGGTMAGRRALTLVEDLGMLRAGAVPEPPTAATLATPVFAPPPEKAGPEDLTQVIIRPADEDRPGPPPAAPKRNAVAAAAGTLLLAVLGTVVAFGLNSGDSEDQDKDDGRDTAPVSLNDEDPVTEEETGPSASPTQRSPRATESPSPEESASESDDPAPPTTPGTPTDDPYSPGPTEDQDPTDGPGGGGGGPGGGGPGGGGPTTDEPTEDPTENPTDDPTDEPTDEPTEDPTEDPTDEPTEDPTDDPTQTTTPTSSDEPPTPTASETTGGPEPGGLPA